jgi:hypothetical protein
VRVEASKTVAIEDTAKAAKMFPDAPENLKIVAISRMKTDWSHKGVDAAIGVVTDFRYSKTQTQILWKIKTVSAGTHEATVTNKTPLILSHYRRSQSVCLI